MLSQLRAPDKLAKKKKKSRQQKPNEAASIYENALASHSADVCLCCGSASSGCSVALAAV